MLVAALVALVAPGGTAVATFAVVVLLVMLIGVALASRTRTS
jgi:hypothetical protein